MIKFIYDNRYNAKRFLISKNYIEKLIKTLIKEHANEIENLNISMHAKEYFKNGIQAKFHMNSMTIDLNFDAWQNHFIIGKGINKTNTIILYNNLFHELVHLLDIKNLSDANLKIENGGVCYIQKSGSMLMLSEMSATYHARIAYPIELGFDNELDRILSDNSCEKTISSLEAEKMKYYEFMEASGYYYGELLAKIKLNEIRNRTAFDKIEIANQMMLIDFMNINDEKTIHVINEYSLQSLKYIMSKSNYDEMLKFK